MGKAYNKPTISILQAEILAKESKETKPIYIRHYSNNRKYYVGNIPRFAKYVNLHDIELLLKSKAHIKVISYPEGIDKTDSTIARLATRMMSTINNKALNELYKNYIVTSGKGLA
jgi:hypothetical protein